VVNSLKGGFFMMRRFFTFVLVLGLLFVVATNSLGAGLFGSTDLMVTPTANTLNPGNFGVSVNLAEGNLSYFVFDYGLANDLEAGAVVYHYPYDTRVSISGKYRLIRESRNGFSLAIGVEDLGETDFSPYLSLAKTFTDVGVKGYVGFGGGYINGPFAGISKSFATNNGSALNQVLLFLEADSNNLNMGVKLSVGTQTKINLGFIDMDRWVMGVTFLGK
jgi:hypothetical protein